MLRLSPLQQSKLCTRAFLGRHTSIGMSECDALGPLLPPPLTLLGKPPRAGCVEPAVRAELEAACAASPSCQPMRLLPSLVPPMYNTGMVPCAVQQLCIILPTERDAVPARLRSLHELGRGQTRSAAGDRSFMACRGGSRGAALEQHPVGSVAGAGQVLREQQVPAAARDTAVVTHCHVRSRSGPGGLPVTWALQGRRECNPTRSVGSPDTTGRWTVCCVSRLQVNHGSRRSHLNLSKGTGQGVCLINAVVS